MVHLTRSESMATILKEGVRAEYFVSSDARGIFSLAMEYYVDTSFKLCVTLDLLQAEYPVWFERNELPTEEYHVNYLIDHLRERYRRNQTQDVVRRIATVVYDDPEQALVSGVNDLAKILYDTATKDRSESYAENYGARIDDYIDQANRPSVVPTMNKGHFFGWPKLTEEMWGLKPSELAVIGGTPGVGKSWLGALLALAAASHGVPTYLASLENSKDMTLRRLDCIHTGVPWRGYERGTLTAVQTEALRQGREDIERLQLEGMLIVDTPRRSTERTVFELYSRARFSGCRMFIGDQLSWATPRDWYRGDRTAQIGEVIRDISDFTKEMDMASVWMSQFNREGQKSGRPRMYNFAATTEIEQIVDWGFALYTDSEKRADEVVILDMLKVRRSDPKVYLLDWKLKEETRLEFKREYREA